MSTQKAVLVQEIDKPCVLVSDREILQPGENEVQIKVSVAGLNPHDQKNRDWGLLVKDILPAILANDVVGTVSKHGSSVSGFMVGDRVLNLGMPGPGHPQGGLQQYAIGSPSTMAKIPDTISDDEAATLPTNATAAFVGLTNVLGLPAPWVTTAEREEKPAPEQLLIVGGGAACGQFAVSIARLSGVRKIVVVGGDEKRLKSLGATDVIDRHGPEAEVLERVRKVVGDNLEYAFDVVNMPEGLSLALGALSKSKKGKLARLLPMREVDGKGHEVLDVMGNVHYTGELVKTWFSKLTPYIESGDIKPTAYSVKEGLTAENVNGALDGYRDGAKVVKPHIHI